VDCVLCVFGVYRLLAVGQLLKFLIVKVHQVGFNFNFNSYNNILKFCTPYVEHHVHVSSLHF
jgi:hypothetical protein